MKTPFVIQPSGSGTFAVVHEDQNIPLAIGLHEINAKFALEIANQVADMYSKTVMLHYGSNDFQEFWQSEADGYLLTHDHKETMWVVNRQTKSQRGMNVGFMFWAKSAEEAVERLGNAKLDTQLQWVGNQLKPAPESDTLTLAEVVAEVSEILVVSEGEFVENIANQVFADGNEVKYDGDSLFTRKAE